MKHNAYDVMIIGGGVAGAAALRDLSMRGLTAVLIEKRSIAGGSSFASHQNLVGGMRYVVKSPDVAKKCAQENRILSKTLPELVGRSLNYFVGFRDDYVEKALDQARSLSVKAEEIDLKEAFKEIPELSRDIEVIVETDDRNLDVRAFCNLNCAEAKREGASVFENTDVVSIKCTARGFKVTTSRGEFTANYIVNATGPWLNSVCQKIDVNIPLVYSQGTIIVQKSLSPRGLQFLHEPSDGDAYIVHNGEAWLGTTSTVVEGPEYARPEPWAEEYLKERFSVVLPKIREIGSHRKFVGVRALLGDDSVVNSRTLSRDSIFHEEPEDFLNIVTGKLTLARLVAEKVADRIVDREGSKTRCRTHIEFKPLEASVPS